MNNLNKVGGGDYNQPSHEEGLIEKTLPLNIFEHILSYLDDMDMQQASLIRRLWSNKAIQTVKREEFSKIKDFAKFLGANLKEESYASQRRELFSVSSDTKILNSVNLIQVKSSIHFYKETFLNILKGLSEDDLKNLEELSKNEPKPKFFENVFDLTRTYKEIDEAGQIPDDATRGSALGNISNTLAQNGNIKKAIEVANTIPSDPAIPSDPVRSHSLQDISNVLTENGNFEKAIEVANTIPGDFTRGHALKNISNALTQNGNFGKAIEVANTIPGDFTRGLALQDISNALMQSGNFEKAIEIANTIPNDDIRGSVLTSISYTLKQSGNFEKAIEVANTIPHDVTREFVLQDINLAKSCAGVGQKKV